MTAINLAWAGLVTSSEIRHLLPRDGAMDLVVGGQIALSAVLAPIVRRGNTQWDSIKAAVSACLGFVTAIITICG